MKKISLICAVALASLSLTACGNSSTKTKNTTSKQTSSKVVKNHHKKKHSNNKKTSQSSSSSAVSSSNQQNNSQQQTQQSNGQQQPKQSGNGLPPATDLHDFVNRYGESPAAYLSEHNGMSPEQAVQSVPNDMKTSGEIQDTYMLQNGQDPFK